jgi:hypothetical protein
MDLIATFSINNTQNNYSKHNETPCGETQLSVMPIEQHIQDTNVEKQLS